MKNWSINTLFSKSLETEKAKSSHFDRTRGYRNQKFPTLGPLLFKSLGVWGWFIPKTFQGLPFLFSGSLSWLMYIWVICPWNKFDEKAQCKTDIRICNWSQINCLKKPQIFKKGISFKNNSEKNIRLVISCFFRFWLATPNSTINSSKFTMWPKKWNLLFSWTKCCENILSNLCEKWSQWNISLKSHFLI